MAETQKQSRWPHSFDAPSTSGVEPRSTRELSEAELGNRYRLRSLLGVGGMGAVYRAYDRELGHEVALKVLHRLTPADRHRLKREFRTLANVTHPNLVTLYELVIEERRCFFTMEVVNGGNVIAHLRESPRAALGFDARVRDVARQLALALHALHSSGKLHRDVKPSNVLVTNAGRVVLVDFGLAAALEPHDALTGPAGFAGTVQYAAPEQVFGGAVTPASDWYSYGVTLYEAISGKLPPSANLLDMMTEQRGWQPRSLAADGHAVPPELDLLIQRLLHPKADSRPDVSEILQCLGGELERWSSCGDATSARAAQVFVGRARELGLLRAAFARVCAGEPRVVQVFGPSGIGKSSLVRTFAAELASSQQLLLLSARCHPRESVPFNAIDGLIDAIAAHVGNDLSSRLPAGDLQALLQVFPGLSRRALPFAEEVAPARNLNGQRLRGRAVRALRELLSGIAEQQPIVLWIDDVQWGDQDSGFVLRELMQQPGAPRVLTLLCCRAEDREQSPCLSVLADEQLGASVLTLEPLPSTEGERMVEHLLAGKSDRDRETLGAWVRESGGSPYFLAEIARYLGAPEHWQDRPQLGNLLLARTQQLPAEARRLLEVACVAGAPIEQALALRAAGLGPDQRGLINSLERECMLRALDSHARTVEVYHHRIRDEVLQQLSAEARAALHQAIGEGLLASARPDALAAVEHFEAAGATELLKRYLVSAANQAAAALAFERAAKLYRRALELGCSDLDRHELLRRLGQVLGDAGRGKEAGEAYLAARAALNEQAEAEPEQAMALERLAADQFLECGHYAQGLRALFSLLDELGIPVPRSRGEALRKAVTLRLWSMLRGLPTGIARSTGDAAKRLREFDALWSVTHSFVMVDYVLTSYTSARCVLAAMDLSEPSRVVRAVGLEAAMCSSIPLKRLQRRADALLGVARELSARTPAPLEQAVVSACEGVMACFRGDFRFSAERVKSASALLRSNAQGVPFQLNQWEPWILIALAHLGELRELSARVHSAAEEARQRGDRFAGQHVRLGRPTLAWLAEDRADEALEQADLALSWAPPQYTTQHYWYFLSKIEIELYRGRAQAAWEHVLKTWPEHEQGHLLQVHLSRDELWFARGRAALAVADGLERGAIARDALPESATRLRAHATDAARKLKSHGQGYSLGWAALLRAELAFQQEQAGLVERELRVALSVFEGNQMGLCREITRLALTRYLPTNEREPARHQAERWLRDQGVLDLAALTRVFLPTLLNAR